MLRGLLKGASFPRLTPQEAREKVLSKEAVIVDVRQKQEWSAGRIPGSTHIPMNRLEKQFEKLPKEKEIILVCRSGSRSSMAAKSLTGDGYKVADIKGGVHLWTREGLPFKGRVA